MYNSIKRTLREMATSEAKSKIHQAEWTERIRACQRAFNTAQQYQAKQLRNKRTKHK